MRPLFFCKSKTWTVGPLMLSALYATHSVAQAQESTKLSGQWYKSSEMAGTGSISNAQGSFVYKFADGTYEGKTPDQNYGDAIGGYVSMNNDGSLYADSNRSAASAKLSNATIKITYRWIPDLGYGYGLGPYPEDMQLEDPDPKFSFLVRGYAGAGAGLQGEASASADGKKGASDEYKNSSVQFKRLFSFDTKGQTEFSAVIPFSAEATLPAGDHMYESTHVNFDAYADIDSRSLSLSRGGAAGDTLDDDGTTMHGDTTYSYNQGRPGDQIAGDPTVLRENWQGIQATFGGTWQSHYQYEGGESYGTSYSWTPAGTNTFYVDSSTGSLQLMPTGQLSMNAAGKWEGTSGADSYTDLPITYEITDSDGAVAKAVYKLRVHEPVELISSETTGITNVVDFFDLSGQPHVDNELTATHSESQSWSITGSIGTEAFGIPLGIDVGTDSSTGYEVSKTLAAYSGQLGPGEYVNAKKELNYNRTHVMFYKYNESGKERRYMSPPGPGQLDPGVPIEVPHEAIWTRFSNWKLSWSEVRRADAGGYPTPATPQPTLPPPSFKYSKREGKKNENPVL